MSLRYKVIFGRDGKSVSLRTKKKVTGIAYIRTASKILERCSIISDSIIPTRYSRDDESHEFRVFELSYSLERFLRTVTINTSNFHCCSGIEANICSEGGGEGKIAKAGCYASQKRKSVKEISTKKINFLWNARWRWSLCRAKNKNTVSTFYPGASMRLRTTNL